ncbi:SH3 domain-containing protein [Phenylobacterium sp.]|jgi:hypothetical protein|uniref:SH3 domain-containing protein n=1 Tax=Phenylobacterium sp. TaxID=1871053 RepID=UPI002E35B4FA|nr:SH3 domain-containing protein [Phenylobacterium sp.]HEX3364829.1 SH3 domain-containing protein [Phenylobacterium sp.]
MGRFAGHRQRRRSCALGRLAQLTAARALTVAVLSGLPTVEAHAVTLPSLHPEEVKAAQAVCAAEREPLVERQKEYGDLRRARLTATFAADAKVGLSMLMASNPLFSLASMARQAGQVSNAINTMNGKGPGGPNANGQPVSAENNAMMTEALTLKVPGLGPPLPSSLVGQEKDARALLAISVVTAISGNLDLYIKIKQEQFGNDTRLMAQSIDGDAASQVTVTTDTATQVKVLADCRSRQVADYKATLAAAADDKERKQLARGQASLRSAVGADLGLSQDLTEQHTTVARTLTQALALAEARSEAEILGDQAPAYAAEASRAALRLIPIAGLNAPPPPKPTFITTRGTVARSAPNAKASVVMNLPAGRTVTLSGHSAQDLSWWEIDVAGTPAYVRGADLAEPGAAAPPEAPAKRKGKGRTQAAAAPPPPPNVQVLNHQALAARTGGVDLLRSLNADLEPPMRQAGGSGR